MSYIRSAFQEPHTIYKWFWVDPFAMGSGGLSIIKRGEAPRRETSAGKIRNHAFRSFTTAFFSIIAKYCFSNSIFFILSG